MSDHLAGMGAYLCRRLRLVMLAHACNYLFAVAAQDLLGIAIRLSTRSVHVLWLLQRLLRNDWLQKGTLGKFVDLRLIREQSWSR